MIDVPSLLSKLSARRPIFHSEADFQHALAWQMQLEYADADLRLEHPLMNGQRGAIDILVRLDNQTFALELKYLSRNLIHETGQDRFALKSQSAHDIRRYDVCKDIQRVEQFAAHTGGTGGVVVLSNDPYYWNGPKSMDTCDSRFNIREGCILSGQLEWSERTGAGSMKGRERPIILAGNYPLSWKSYSNLAGAFGAFRYLYVPVPKQSAELSTPGSTISNGWHLMPSAPAIKPETVLARVRALISELAPKPVCDDCISIKLDLSLRQHANAMSRQLAVDDSFKREIGVCWLCKSCKKVIWRV